MEPRSPHWNDNFIQFGLGAFETMRCIDGQVPLIEFHLERLSRALKAFDCSSFNLDPSWNQQLLTIPTKGQFRVKWFLGLDQNRRIKDHLYIQPYKAAFETLTCLALPAPFNQAQIYKSSSYDQHWLAHQKATRHQCDDAIYLLPDSQIVECSRASVLLTDPKNGFYAKGPNLQSVSVAALKSQNSDFWSGKNLYLNQIKKEEQLWCSNALHGVRAIRSIVDLQGRELYRSENHAQTHPKIESLFHEN